MHYASLRLLCVVEATFLSAKEFLAVRLQPVFCEPTLQQPRSRTQYHVVDNNFKIHGSCTAGIYDCPIDCQLFVLPILDQDFADEPYWVYGTSVVVFVVFWTVGGVYTLMDITGKPAFLRRDVPAEPAINATRVLK
ncbi:hypothetical protein B566_EDAN002815, partial [Ephemera danica]